MLKQSTFLHDAIFTIKSYKENGCYNGETWLTFAGRSWSNKLNPAERNKTDGALDVENKWFNQSITVIIGPLWRWLSESYSFKYVREPKLYFKLVKSRTYLPRSPPSLTAHSSAFVRIWTSDQPIHLNTGLDIN